eukprot:250849-Chlamydomonas_euryale.AAC.7
MPIEVAEQAAAKSKYSGRLTREAVEEQLGHSSFERLASLSLTALRIRDVGSVFMCPEWQALRELDLDGNLLVEVSGLALLRRLQ